MLSSVRDLLPEVAAAAADVDRTGVVDRAVIARLHEAGYFALLQPPDFGGLDADPDIYLTATRELSSACMSTGWLAGWLAVNNWGLSVRDRRVLHELWGGDPQTLLCSSYAPTGRLERVPGGFRLSGRWARCTGSPYASWLECRGAEGRRRRRGAGLHGGTGPAQRLHRGTHLEWIGITRNRCRRRHRHRCLRPGIPRVQLARHGARSRVARAAATAPTDPLHVGRDDAVAGCRPMRTRRCAGRVAPARADIELSMMQIRRNVAEQLDCVRGERYPDAELMLRTRRDQVMASDRALRAVGAVIDDPGPDADAALLERIWRDVQTARMHVASNVEQVLTVVGRHSVGIAVDDLMW